MKLVAFILCICAVLADTQPCMRSGLITVDRSYKEGKALKAPHVLAINNIRQVYENKGQEATLIALVRNGSAADDMRLVLQLFGVYEEPRAFAVSRLTAYDDEGNVVATVHYLLNNTDSAPRPLSAKRYDELLQSCKEVAEEKMTNSTAVLVEKSKYKVLSFARAFGIFAKILGQVLGKAGSGVGRGLSRNIGRSVSSNLMKNVGRNIGSSAVKSAGTNGGNAVKNVVKGVNKLRQEHVDRAKEFVESIIN
ncbi:hypothetical protein Aduo_000579 [Ancylostoma duodenale]